MPARRQGITASQEPISEDDRKRGDRIGHDSWIPSVTQKRALRHVEIDTNYCPAFVAEGYFGGVGTSQSSIRG